MRGRPERRAQQARTFGVKSVRQVPDELAVRLSGGLLKLRLTRVEIAVHDVGPDSAGE